MCRIDHVILPARRQTRTGQNHQAPAGEVRRHDLLARQGHTETAGRSFERIRRVAEDEAFVDPRDRNPGVTEPVVPALARKIVVAL